MNNTLLFIQGQIAPISLSSAKRELIKELCSPSANHRGLFKVCTCSPVSYIFNEGKLLHLSQVNGSMAPLVVKLTQSEAKRQGIISLIGAYELIIFRTVINAIIRLQ